MNPKIIIMKNNVLHNTPKDTPTQTGQHMNQNTAAPGMKVHVAGVKPWKDHYEHEKVIRQRQDLFDNWEQRDKNHLLQSTGV